MNIPLTIIPLLIILSYIASSSAHNHASNPNSEASNAFVNLLGCRLGKKCDGVAELKKYFRFFGYLDSSYTDFSDLFDDYLEYATKTYQQNFNLNPTGEIDSETLNQIVHPRCGYPDIVNGTTRMHSGKPSPGSHKIHSLSHYSFFVGAPRWPASKRQLTYAFLPANQLTVAAKAVFAKAFRRWSAVTLFTFTEVAAYATADIKIAFYRGDHGDGYPFDGRFTQGMMSTLAHAFAPTNGRFHLDADERWVLNGNFNRNSSLSEFDVETVSVHEIGHLLGLGHSSVPEAIMFPTTSPFSTKLTLANDDIVGIKTLYGLN